MQLRGILAASSPTHTHLDRPAPPARIAACDLHPILWFRNPSAKPQAFDSTAALVRALARTGRGDPIDGANQIASFTGDVRTRRVVAIWTLGPGGGRNEWLGYVWLAGAANPQALLCAAFRDLQEREAA
jgi:hypothetical protein